MHASVLDWVGVIANDAGLDVVEIATDPEGPGYFMHCTKP